MIPAFLNVTGSPDPDSDADQSGVSVSNNTSQSEISTENEPIPHHHPLFTQISDKSISFDNKQYDFASVFAADLAPNDILTQVESSEPHSSSSCVLFMGPAGSGKTSTLRRILHKKVDQLSDKDAVSLTAFEVSDNKHFFDLLQFDKRKSSKSFLTSMPIESQLRKERFITSKAAHLTMNKIFQRRNHNQSDASCQSNMLITFYTRNNTKKTTYIDLSDIPGPHSFANFDTSSIVQLLTNTHSNSASLARLSGSFNEFIFRKSDRGAIKLVLSLNQHGDFNVAKQALSSISQLNTDSNYLSGSAEGSANHLSTPSYAKPTASSSNPPVSASNPSSDRISRTSTLHSKWQNGDSSSSKTSIKVPNKFKISRSAVTKGSGVITANRLTTKVYEDQVSQLKTQIADLETHNQELKHEYHLIFERLSEQKLELNNDLIKFKNDHECEISELKSKLSESAIISTNSKILLQQKQNLNDKLNEFKSDWDNTKSASQNLSQTILNLKLSAERLSTQNNDLAYANKTLQKELQEFKTTLQQKEIDHATFQNEYERVKSENSDFKSQLESMSQSNNKELEDIKKELAEQQRLFQEMEKAKDESIERIRSTSTSFEKLINENNSAISNHKAEVSNMTKVNSALSATVDEHKVTIDHQQDKIQTLTRENFDLSIELDSKKTEHEALTRKFNDMKINHDSETSQLKKQIAIKDELIEAKNKIIESQTQEISRKMKELEQRKQVSTEAISSLHEEILIKKQELDAMKKSLSLVEGERDSFIERYEQSLDTNDKLQNKNKSITAKYEQMLKMNKETIVENSSQATNSSRGKEIDHLRTMAKGKVSERKERFDKLASVFDSTSKIPSANDPFLDGFSSPRNFFAEGSPSDIFHSERDIYDDHTHHFKTNDVVATTHTSLPSPLKASNTYDSLVGSTLKRKIASPARNEKQPRLSPSI